MKSYTIFPIRIKWCLSTSILAFSDPRVVNKHSSLQVQYKRINNEAVPGYLIWGNIIGMCCNILHFTFPHTSYGVNWDGVRSHYTPPHMGYDCLWITLSVSPGYARTRRFTTYTVQSTFWTDPGWPPKREGRAFSYIPLTRLGANIVLGSILRSPVTVLAENPVSI